MIQTSHPNAVVSTTKYDNSSAKINEHKNYNIKARQIKRVRAINNFARAFFKLNGLAATKEEWQPWATDFQILEPYIRNGNSQTILQPS